jgi:predicted nucleotidyltransferase component of viral defense system
MPGDWQALYALPDVALACLSPVEHQFDLTGGTALGRGYDGHRFSEDLDFFVNDAADSELWRDRLPSH